ncbi:hypothetical protein [Paenibacillus sp. P46E]|jgi:hypothetical protein|uniref:hypothetical protein n=1 Tax=Paenibacillus sp. P46E TaxID=1349436 RepID=UPI000A908EAF|nr:hypothetical protein [Paenibacillus sp. P46E]
MEKNKSNKTDRREYMRQYSREWRKKNPEKEREKQERYWARRLGMQPVVSASPVENH